MGKTLTIYPTAEYKELAIHSGDYINSIKIMDLRGTTLYNAAQKPARENTIDITHFPTATYIVEVSFDDNRKGRSLFVKE